MDGSYAGVIGARDYRAAMSATDHRDHLQDQRGVRILDPLVPSTLQACRCGSAFNAGWETSLASSC
jgi:hypothetical protein